MAYCNISDAFNINQKFDETIKGLQSFNPSNYELNNMRNSYGTLTNIENDYESPYGAPFNDGKSLNGTDLSNLMSDNQSQNQNQNQNQNHSQSQNHSQKLNSVQNNMNTIKNPKIKLTHRDCISIYTSPKNHPDDTISNALKHITKCTLCKNGIKNIQKNFMDNTQTLSISEFDQAKESSQITGLSGMNGLNTNSIPKIMNFSNQNPNPNLNPNQYINQVPLQPIQYTIPAVSTESSVMIENKLKMLSDKINEENNLKYQNAILQNTISKYMEDAEEKKQFNCKMDKILTMLQQNQINLNNPMLNSNIQKENFNNYAFRPEFFQSGNNNSNGIDWILIGIVVIIILLVIDIYLRIASNKKII